MRRAALASPLTFSACLRAASDLGLVLTAVFTILSEHLFNEESPYCLVPDKYKILHKLIDTNNDDKISENEFNNAVHILEKYKHEKDIKKQKHSFTLFHNYLSDSYNQTT